MENSNYWWESLLDVIRQTFPPIIWILTKCEGDGIKSRLSFKIVSTLLAISEVILLLLLHLLLSNLMKILNFRNLFLKLLNYKLICYFLKCHEFALSLCSVCFIDCKKKVRMKYQRCLWHIDDIDTIIFRPFEEGGPPGPRGQGGESSPVPQPSSGIKSVR